MQVEPGAVHDEKHDGEDQRHRQRNDDAGAPAERQEAHDQDDSERLAEALDEFRYRFVDDVGLISDLGHLDADRQLGCNGFIACLRLSPSVIMLAPSGIETPSPRAGCRLHER